MLQPAIKPNTSKMKQGLRKWGSNTRVPEIVSQSSNGLELACYALKSSYAYLPDDLCPFFADTYFRFIGNVFTACSF
jgi:hypothetical protein